MHIDLTPLVGALGPLALAALSAVAAWGVRQASQTAKKSLGINLTAQQRGAILQACDVGAQRAYAVLVGAGAHYLDVPVRNAAIAEGANHVLASVPAALAAEGITADHVHAMVASRLGGLLARDPTTTIAPGASAPDAAKPAA